MNAKTELYRIITLPDGLGNAQVFKALADGHEQHIWSETSLIGLRPNAVRRIKKYRAGGYIILVTIAGRQIGLTNARQ